MKFQKKNNNSKHIKAPDGYDDRIYKKPILKNKKNLIKKLKLTYNWYKGVEK